MSKRYTFPFVAIVGQEKLKKALILNLINPKIGGVLICGEKGTAKSTLVRGIQNVIKDVEVVDLPLNITEDRLVGGIDIEKAIKCGERCIENGVLKKAHKNILYIDEVNLLSEHIVNIILNVSASKLNVIDREGLSTVYESDFILVGSMNPEEGSLRSQFIDRFGLYIEIKGSKDLSERMEIIKRRLDFEKNPDEYINKYKNEEANLRDVINFARKRISNIQIKEHVLNIASQLAQKANCDGHRGELILVETAKAIAALDNRNYITSEDLKEASELALPHRMKNQGIDNKQNLDKQDNKENQENSQENNDNPKDNNAEQPTDTENEKQENSSQEDISQELSEEDNNNEDNNEENNNDKNEQNQNSNLDSSENDEVFDIGEIFKVKNISLKPLDKKFRNGSGKRTKTKTALLQGRYIKYKAPKDKVKDLAFDATIRCAAVYQSIRKNNELALKIEKSDIKEKIREKRTGTSILFLVDASGSMGANKRMEAVKGAIISLLSDAYEKRDKVGMIAFRKDKAELLLNITRSVELAKKELKDMPIGGKTPLGLGLEKGYKVLMQENKKDKDAVSVMIIVSDGRATYSNNSGDPFDEVIKISHQIKESNIQTIVVDCEQGFIKLEMAKQLAESLGATYYKVDDLKQNDITNVVKQLI